MADVYAEIPKGLRRLGDSCSQLADIVTAIDKKVRSIRIELQNADRNEAALSRIAGVQKQIDESTNALNKALKAIVG
jgi:hypothetical protein